MSIHWRFLVNHWTMLLCSTRQYPYLLTFQKCFLRAPWPFSLFRVVPLIMEDRTPKHPTPPPFLHSDFFFCLCGTFPFVCLFELADNKKIVKKTCKLDLLERTCIGIAWYPIPLYIYCIIKYWYFKKNTSSATNWIRLYIYFGKVSNIYHDKKNGFLQWNVYSMWSTLVLTRLF